MGKVKIPRSSVFIDMTPMVDMAFLLVTFFILTAKFRPDEPVVVTTPSSTSTVHPPDKGLAIITISNDGRIFFNLDNQKGRMSLIQKMGDTYGISFSQDEITAYSIGSSIGVPMSGIQEYLSMESDERKMILQPGIPVDSTKNLSNELGVWLVNARIAGNNPVILIKGDGQANYPVVKYVLSTLQQNNVLRFGFITNEEAEPTVNDLK